MGQLNISLEPHLRGAHGVVRVSVVRTVGGNARDVAQVAVVCPRGVAGSPRQVGPEGVYQIEERYGHERAVVGCHGNRSHKLAVSHS